LEELKSRRVEEHGEILKPNIETNEKFRKD
jgi:hypothetical protein